MFANYYEFRDWIENFIPLVYGREELGLARIEELLKRLENPEKKFKSVHIAGTAGKGSTAFYIARLLCFSRNHLSRTQEVTSKNLKIGLHVSPHLNYIGERMQINGEAIPVKKLIKVIELIKPVVEKIQKEKPELTPSYFEILVAVSFMYFAQEKVDFAVVEVGLGGRLDATNVLTPEVSVITNIGLDHTEILGDSIEKIAAEKAGIIKQGVPVVTGAQGKALGVIERIAAENKSPVIRIDDSEDANGNNLHINKSLALAAVTELGVGPDGDDLEAAFSVGFAGRFEEIEPGVVLDGAHNVDKMRALIEYIKHNFQGRTFKIVLAFKTGKNWKEMVDILLKDLPIREVVATEYQAVTDTGKGSAVKPEEICDYITKVHSAKCVVNSNSQEAVWEAMQSSIDDCLSTIVVTGSLYLVGEVRTMWKLPTV